MNDRIIPVNAVNEPQRVEGAQDRGEPLELLEYWRSVTKHKWAILGLALAITLLTLLVVSSINPTYRSTATLLIDAGKNKVISIEEVYARMGSNREYFQTQAEILSSRELAKKVVAKLNLGTHPEFDSRQQEPPYWKKWLAAVGITPERVGFGEAGTSAPPDKGAIPKGVVAKVQRQLRIEPVRTSQLIRVSFEAHDPELAAKVANTFAETFIENDLDARYQMTQKASDWLAERLGGLR
ncbi:MAG: hypothetical protein IH605_17370, partial [Burkholderiales bacterium]|nr:hypothetical protein [Burkholderiales bacterium]